MNNRVQIPTYMDMWMRGDRFGAVIKKVTRNGVTIAHVLMERSGKTVRCILNDCTEA